MKQDVNDMKIMAAKSSILVDITRHTEELNMKLQAERI
jgi:hypothetical protein